VAQDLLTSELLRYL